MGKTVNVPPVKVTVPAVETVIAPVAAVIFEFTTTGPLVLVTLTLPEFAVTALGAPVVGPRFTSAAAANVQLPPAKTVPTTNRSGPAVRVTSSFPPTPAFTPPERFTTPFSAVMVTSPTDVTMSPVADTPPFALVKITLPPVLWTAMPVCVTATPLAPAIVMSPVANTAPLMATPFVPPPAFRLTIPVLAVIGPAMEMLLAVLLQEMSPGPVTVIPPDPATAIAPLAFTVMLPLAADTAPVMETPLSSLVMAALPATFTEMLPATVTASLARRATPDNDSPKSAPRLAASVSNPPTERISTVPVAVTAAITVTELASTYVMPVPIGMPTPVASVIDSVSTSFETFVNCTGAVPAAP